MFLFQISIVFRVFDLVFITMQNIHYHINMTCILNHRVWSDYRIVVRTTLIYGVITIIWGFNTVSDMENLMLYHIFCQLFRQISGFTEFSDLMPTISMI